MNKTTRRGYALIPVILAFLAGTVILIFQFAVHGAAWSSNRANAHLFKSGSLSTAGTIFDTTGKTLAKTVNGKRVFNNSRAVRKATLHVVGDPLGMISTGAHAAYKSKLSGYSFIDGIYSIQKYGRGNDLTLAVSADACAAAWNALGGYNGAVGVFNYKTGALLCSVSAPSFDVNDPPSDPNKLDGVYLNRLFSGVYTPGSTMKIVTALCALENIPDIESRTFTCTGRMQVGGGEVVCMGTHGEIGFQKALNKSCNCAFAQIAQLLGPEKLMATAQSLGFNLPIKTDGIQLAISSFDVRRADALGLSWAGVGQYDTLVNPCHMMMIAGAIAAGGQGVQPYVIRSMQSPSGVTVYKAMTRNSQIVIPAANAQKLRQMLRTNVTEQYGDSRFPNLQMCGKTGTAELDGKTSHSWFVGFSMRDDLPLAVVVVAENAGSGAGVAMSTANAVMQSLLYNKIR